MPTQAVQNLMANLIDYAGLFPPAKLSMREAVDNYAEYIASEEAWMLGRFICPVSRLDEFAEHAAAHLPTTDATEPWQLSGIIDGDLDESLDAIFAFNDRHEDAEQGSVLVDTIELKAPTPQSIDDALDLMPHELFCFFEIPQVNDVRGFITALAGNDAAAKIRTGGVTPDLIPPSEFIASFIFACAAADVPFKATAGLHHPVRAEYDLTYEKGSPRGTMHGFLNVFITASLVRDLGLSVEEATHLLNTTDPSAFSLSETSAGVGGCSIDATKLARWRETFALSYGSCSFREPVADLVQLGLL